MTGQKTHPSAFQRLIGKILHTNCTRFLMVFTTIGLLMLTFDSFLEHYFAPRAIRSYQWIPIIFGVVATPIAFVIALRRHLGPLSTRLWGSIALVSILVGVIGLYFHLVALVRMLPLPVSWQSLFTALRFGPPLLAPLAFTGVGMLGMIAIFGPADLLNFLFEKFRGTSHTEVHEMSPAEYQ